MYSPQHLHLGARNYDEYKIVSKRKLNVERKENLIKATRIFSLETTDMYNAMKKEEKAHHETLVSCSLIQKKMSLDLLAKLH